MSKELLGSLTAAEVRLKITNGDEKCEADQKAIGDAAKKLANAKRLAVRQEWAANKKAYKALLTALEIDEPKEEEVA